MNQREKWWNIARTVSPWVLIGYWITLFTATHVPVPAGPPTSDKLIHFGAYFVLSLLLSTVLLTRNVLPAKIVLWTVIVLFSYGVFDEATQALVDRHPDPLDALADWAGVVTGLVVFFSALRFLASSKPPGE